MHCHRNSVTHRNSETLAIALTFSMQFVEAKPSLVEVNVRWIDRHALAMIFNNISILLGKSAS